MIKVTKEQLTALPLIGGTKEKPWFIPFGHPLASKKEISGGKGSNCSIMFEFTEGIASYEYFSKKFKYGPELSKSKFENLLLELKILKAKVPFGYLESVYWYEHLMKKHGVDTYFESMMEEYDVNNLSNGELEQIGVLMEKKIMAIPLEEAERNAIEEMRQQIELATGKSMMSVRSNGVIEDGLHHGFHGKGKTVLYRTTAEEIFEANKVSMSSRHLLAWNSYMYTSVFKDERYHFKSFQFDFALADMDMIQNQRCGGTLWTIDNTSGHEGFAILNMTPKNGEASVASKGGAHKYEISKLALNEGRYGIVSKTLGEAKEMLVRGEDGENLFVPVPQEMQTRFLLTDEEAMDEVRIAMIFDQLYNRTCGDYECGPADMENGEVWHYFVQGRPITTHFEDPNELKTYRLGTLNETEENPYADKLTSNEGEQVGALAVARAWAFVKAINTPEWEHVTMQKFFEELEDFRRNKAMELGLTDPMDVPIFGIFDETTQQMEPWLYWMKGFGSNSGNTTGHTAGYAGEIDVPAFVSAKNIMDVVKTGDFITVDTSNGVPYIYAGELPYVVSRTSIQDLPVAPINVGSICGSEAQAAKVARKFSRKNNNVGGVKLARIESKYAQLAIFPLVFQDVANGTFMEEVKEYCLSHYGGLNSHRAELEIADAQKIQKEVLRMSAGYKNSQEFFESQIQYMMAKMAAANRFPNEVHDVTVRSCDLKMKEFGKQPGAKYYRKYFKGITADDMRGGLMLINEKFRFIYEAELKAVKFCRETIGLDNLDYENAFVRTLEEKDQLDSIADANGVDSATNSMMFELPSNFFLATQFLMKLTRKWEMKNGRKTAIAKVKVGGNDGVYTFYVIDRLSGKVLTRVQMSLAFETLTNMLSEARKKVYENTGIWIELGSCGNGPSLYDEQAHQLVVADFDSVGVTPSKIIPLVFKLTGLSMEGKTIEEEVLPEFDLILAFA